MDDKIFELAAVMPVMLMGAPGVGKTTAVTDFARRVGADLLDVRLSAETPSSFEGKDYIVPQTGELRKARAWWLKRIDENKARGVPTVLFFDEYTNAPDALQQLAYSPFNERKLHGVSFDYKLAHGAAGLYVFAAGNRVEDETGAREVVHATKTRVFTVDVDVSAGEWLRWAEGHGIHAVVRAFIQADPAALLEKPSTGTACPREWVNLSRALAAGIPYRAAAHGTVRGAYEAAFCAFYEDSTLVRRSRRSSAAGRSGHRRCIWRPTLPCSSRRCASIRSQSGSFRRCTAGSPHRVRNARSRSPVTRSICWSISSSAMQHAWRCCDRRQKRWG